MNIETAGEKINDQQYTFVHRDISWLAFNERVMDEAGDPENPLLEQAKFLAIFVNNLDEYFMVRVAGLKRLIDSRYSSKDKFGYFPSDVLDEIEKRLSIQLQHLHDFYETIKKDLQKNKIFILPCKKLNTRQQRFVKRFFETTLFPIITPMAVDEGHPFPLLSSRTIAFAVNITRYNQLHHAILPLPRSISRILKLPSERDENCFILIDEIIRNYLPNFFKGYKVTGAFLFRLIRDSELSFEEEYAPNLLQAIESELKKRPKAKVVHMEIEEPYPNELLDFLCSGINFPLEKVTKIRGTLDLTYLFSLISQVHKPNLVYRSFIPAKKEYDNIFDYISENDFLLHVPYQSFQPTVDLIKSAADDPNVLAIKMTLYRTNEHSAIIEALKTAAKNKKQVTVLVELKARFDEERNISWARELEDAGCHVIYGISGMKIHSKVTLVVRKEEGRIQRYVHLATGNYNEFTARIYTDIGYFTANEDFSRDVSDVFNVITGYSLPSGWKRIVSSPDDLRNYFFELIDHEIEYQKKYKNGLIFVKMNSLEDTLIIEKLYEASRRGVIINLLIRGICCLIPGVPGMSETITVKSLVGRFLEHSRIFLFHNNGNERLFLSSADWMTRNFDQRIELLFEVYKKELRQELSSILDTYWKDTAKTWIMLSDARYKTDKKRENGFNAQEFLIENKGNVS